MPRGLQRLVAIVRRTNQIMARHGETNIHSTELVYVLTDFSVFASCSNESFRPYNISSPTPSNDYAPRELDLQTSGDRNSRPIVPQYESKGANLHSCRLTA